MRHGIFACLVVAGIWGWGGAQGAVPSLVPDEVATYGYRAGDVDRLQVGLYLYPDGRLYFHAYAPYAPWELEGPRSMRVDLPPETIRRYFRRLDPIPLKEQRWLLTKDGKGMDMADAEKRRIAVEKQPLLVTKGGAAYRRGSYYAPFMDEYSKQLVGCEYCEYHGPNLDLWRKIQAHDLSIAAIGWTRACTAQEKAEGGVPDCGYSQRYVSKVAFAALVPHLFPSREGVVLRPLPRSEWRYLRCRGWILEEDYPDDPPDLPEEAVRELEQEQQEQKAQEGK